ncbi:LPS biosynthesis protein RfbU [Lysinibacillus alkalisoli]|uniref:LPS biosynthesis protein RfbU n=1 Tax=Lysinibacillus alkalisoli TaxID=1911548 RepID=A0A917D6X2_9BACI|nr:glycosyltransferase [Lysinibacillus alkalisoli]GGG13078.1 LPS biosynthesis protein RfbU [Lysinibacillus alkalisoli]
MKKILIISNMYPTDNHLSFGIFVKNQVRALEEAGMNVVIAVNDDPTTGKWPVIKKYMKWGLKTLTTAFRQRKQISVTHAHYAFPSGMLALIVKRLFGIPYVVTAHGGDIERMAKKSTRLHNWTETILKNSEHVIAVGPVLAEQIEHDFSIPKEKISVLSMGVNRRIFYPIDKNIAREQVHLAQDAFHFLFVGNVIEQKGVEELVQAFQMVKTSCEKPVKLTIIGARRDEGFQKKLQPFIDEDVQFIDPLAQQELVKWFQAADVFVLPSHLEGFGLVALEALAAGTPVIATQVGGLVSLLNNGAGHLVPPHHASELAQEMKRATTRVADDYYHVSAVNAVLEQHDEKNITAQLQQIYEVAAKGGRRV